MDQVNGLILAGLFPHLSQFTPAQNKALLDIITSPVWCPDGAFRLGNSTAILFGLGKPSEDLITQMLGRCMNWTAPPYAVIDTLFTYVAFPIQRFWAAIPGTRILDTVLAAYLISGGRPFPVDTILKV